MTGFATDALWVTHCPRFPIKLSETFATQKSQDGVVHCQTSPLIVVARSCGPPGPDVLAWSPSFPRRSTSSMTQLLHLHLDEPTLSIYAAFRLDFPRSFDEL
ncbi:unnamed protein product [Somion occarium]|uniref:Uncharacterized protein n=1 Tax=Somion occarium TaxID=3059160 RepID=A0ABP1DMT6_9APHY